MKDYTQNIIIIIPARGGSKGIPRKNLRLLNGKPLIYYSIKNGLSSKFNASVFVTTEDQEIGLIAKKFGAKVHFRPENLADDISTLDPVVFNCLIHAEQIENKTFDIVVTLQPTSPLLRSNELDAAIEKLLKNENISTVISAKEDTHLTWSKYDNKFSPNYEKRVNRQYLKPIYKETGGFLITRRDIINVDSRIGENVDLHLLSNGQEIDIDDYNDWNLCQYILEKRKILFVVAGNKTIGLGHVYNTLIVANDILNHEIEFLVLKGCELAHDKIASKNYKVFLQQNDDLLEDIKKREPYLVINDILDTNSEYILGLKSSGYKVLNFEDLGNGAMHADAVINAIYPEKEVYQNHYFGQKYFILRDEFIFNFNDKNISNKVQRILITFGGVDPCNLTFKVIDSINEYCKKNQIEINVIAGLGYDKYESIESFENVKIHKNVSNISEFMFDSDLIFTSAGRTVYEIASIGVPTIVLAQNNREMTHFFAFEEYGFINLGLGNNISNENIFENALMIIHSNEKRLESHKKMKQQNLKLGRKKVNEIINNIIDGI